MNHSALTPVFTTLKVGLHLLMGGLSALVIVRSAIEVSKGEAVDAQWLAILLTLLLAATYAAGRAALHPDRPRLRYAWLLVLTLEWLGLTTLTADAAFLVFPLFFIYLHLLPRPQSVLAVLMSTALAIVALAGHSGWSIGGVIGPCVGAAVAIMISLGYQALFREAAERDRLIADLIATRKQLADTEREAGTLAERSRLAREIHDTVAQGLSSIQLLLHAVELQDPDHPAIEHIRLARETAAENLLETRRFISDLSPRALQGHTLHAAIRRLAESASRPDSLSVHVSVSGSPVTLPMAVETALLRIAQGALANVMQHSNASQAEVTLSYMSDSIALDIVDNGQGFAENGRKADRAHPDRQSFGLAAIRDRAIQLGGTVTIESHPGDGTAVAVSIPLPSEEPS